MLSRGKAQYIAITLNRRRFSMGSVAGVILVQPKRVRK